MSEEDYKIAYENVMIANKMLEKENKRLNNIINEFEDFITNVDSHINLGNESEEFILVRDKWLELQELKGSDSNSND